MRTLATRHLLKAKYYLTYILVLIALKFKVYSNKGIDKMLFLEYYTLCRICKDGKSKV